jgi:hypothetical protein
MLYDDVFQSTIRASEAITTARTLKSRDGISQPDHPPLMRQ